jgi:hypothetical protein
MKQSAIALSVSLLAAAAMAEEEPSWVARLQLGSARIHEWNDADTWGEIRVGRRFAGGLFSADVGPSGSHSGEGYVGLTLGLEVLPLPRAMVSPYARVEAGGLWEPEGLYATGGVGGGLAVRLSDRLSLRGGASWAVHSGVEGPVVYSGGVQFHW